MTSIINASVDGIVFTASSTAALDIQAGGTNAVQIGTGATTTISNATITSLTISNPSSFPAGSASAPAVTTTGDTNTGVYFPAADEVAVSAGGTVAAAFNSNGLFFRNRIINGDMRIDQRNAGAATTINSTSNTFTLDRWVSSGQVADGVFTVQQDTLTPTGFINSTKITVTTADASLSATQSYLFRQFIEGTNTADLGWGAAGALTVTLSFWVRSSVTGTFGGVLQNATNDRNYPFTYVINAADTWEYKTITVAGDTTGTWGTGTGRGITVTFSLGVGSSASATAGVWNGTSQIYGATGATNLMATLNATWYITGVQLETGSVATPFERRPYGTELMLCQRYLPAFISSGTASAIPGNGVGAATTYTAHTIPFMVQARVAPTGVTVSNGSHFTVDDGVSFFACDSLSFNISSPYGAQVLPTRSAAGLTQYRPYNLRFNNASGYLLFTGCEL